MAISQLHSTKFFFPPTTLPTQRSPSPSPPPPPRLLTLHPSKHMPPPLSLQPKTQFLIHTTLLKHPIKTQYQEDKEFPFQNLNNPGPLSVAFPALEFANTLFFNSAYNVQVIVRSGEPEESLIGRFLTAVLKAGVIQESKRRRFFETAQEKRKRKARAAARRNRKRQPQSKASRKDKAEVPKKKDDPEDDNWEDFDVDLPYC
ncbi:uncharacterized protein [Primulina huaijiensis]|uniref:uncharacterized protein n=1 Tax=Primulina huaijiensis TaxID=1492673 RepID=UPI003CC6F484